MARIKPPFPYFGNKGRFYKEIKEIFQENFYIPRSTIYS